MMKRHTVFVGITAGTLLVLSATATVVAFNALFEDSTNMGQAQLSSLKPATESVRQQLQIPKPVASPPRSVVIKVPPTPAVPAPPVKNNPDTSVSSTVQDNNVDNSTAVDDPPQPPFQPPSDDTSEPDSAPTIEPNDDSNDSSKNVSDDSISEEDKGKGEPQEQNKGEPEDD